MINLKLAASRLAVSTLLSLCVALLEEAGDPINWVRKFQLSSSSSSSCLCCGKSRLPWGVSTTLVAEVLFWSLAWLASWLDGNTVVSSSLPLLTRQSSGLVL